MRSFIVAGVLTLSFLLPTCAALAFQPPHPSQAVTSQPDENTLREHGRYQNVDGKLVHSPAHTVRNFVPNGASAKCEDGSYSFSLHRQGTCSHHGGVAQWL
ncbi:DUF3761 domain-containing protein [Gluconobacter sphaericus]|uniref:DUF3761 domain-containing protein n=1 Tax=Gluconobacter sphaericus TaxID=574987 RepID=UPI0019225640|nr:DUF3761 domain-containing protein [Gluconobacter sphaericus]